MPNSISENDNCLMCKKYHHPRVNCDGSRKFNSYIDLTHSSHYSDDVVVIPENLPFITAFPNKQRIDFKIGDTIRLAYKPEYVVRTAKQELESRGENVKSEVVELRCRDNRVVELFNELEKVVNKPEYENMTYAATVGVLDGIKSKLTKEWLDI